MYDNIKLAKDNISLIFIFFIYKKENTVKFIRAI